MTELEDLRRELARAAKVGNAENLKRYREHANDRPRANLLNSDEMAEVLGMSGCGFHLFAKRLGVSPEIKGHHGVYSWWNPETFKKAMKAAIKERKS